MDPNKRFLSSASNGETPNGQSFVGDDSSFFDDDFDDTYDEAFDEVVNHEDDVSLTPSDNSRVYPVSCTVVYGYTVSSTFIIFCITRVLLFESFSSLLLLAFSYIVCCNMQIFFSEIYDHL